MMPACNKHKAFQMAHTNEMTAHIWAQQEKGSGRSNNGNLSFEGPVLYSYTTPIARFTTDAKGRPAVLITSHTYSKTTSCKHMPALWRAIDYGRGRFSPAFRVPRLGQSQFGGAHALNLNDDHKPNLAYLIAQYHETVAKASRARTYYQAGLLDYLEKLAARAVDYAKAFKLKAPKFAPEADFAKVEALRAARDAKNATPAAIAKRARAVAAREALAEHKAALARLEGAEKLAAWRRGEPVSLGYFGESRDAQGGALLRVKGDNLETSSASPSSAGNAANNGTATEARCASVISKSMQSPPMDRLGRDAIKSTGPRLSNPPLRRALPTWRALTLGT
jgi:hypothetical protein